MLDADPHRVVARHSHEDAHFVLVLEGLYVSSAMGAPAISRGPMLVFNPAGTTHRDRFEARMSTFEGRFLTLSVSTDLMDASAKGRRAPERATALCGPDALDIAQRLAREVDGWTNVSPFVSESLALALLSAVTRPRTPSACTPPQWLAVAREALHDRCNEDVRIAELAQVVGVHPVHLARVFRRYLGCTPGDYLRRRRLERSNVLLRDTTRTIADVALSCGFSDQSHFANAFKRHTGLTPGAFRRQTD
ncbi:MAG: helix-turn-helix transcriptional regulator [bacterium]